MSEKAVLWISIGLLMITVILLISWQACIQLKILNLQKKSVDQLTDILTGIIDDKNTFINSSPTNEDIIIIKHNSLLVEMDVDSFKVITQLEYRDESFYQKGLLAASDVIDYSYRNLYSDIKRICDERQQK